MKAVYYWTYDNPKGGNYRRPVRELGRVAEVDRIAPKTTLRLERYPGVTFAQVQTAAAGTLDGKKGPWSALLHPQRARLRIG